MQHITYADKSVLIGDEVAETLMEYAALIAREGSADTVKVCAIGSDGDEVVAIFLLGSGTNLMSETTHSSLAEPDNSDALMYMRERMMRLSNPPQIRPDNETMPVNYEDLHLE